MPGAVAPSAPISARYWPATAKTLRHVSARWRCVQKALGEVLVQLNGGSWSSAHLVWGHRAQQDRSEQDPENNAVPIQPSYIFNSLPSGEPAPDVAYITRDVVIIRYATNKAGCRVQNAIR